LSPEEKEISSPDNRKQRHHSNEHEFDQPNSTRPIEIDFGRYKNNNIMDNIDDTGTTLVRNEGNNNNTEMEQVEEINNNASESIKYTGSSGSFCSTDSDGTATVIEEEEQSITGHNFNNTVNIMDYTNMNNPRTIRTKTKSTDGFTAVQNGSPNPNRNSIRERRESRVSNNPYSALQASNIPSAKDRLDRKND
jgi:hypothetical protein